MSADIRYELSLVALSVMTGFLLMAVYDCLRIIRIIFKHKDIWIGIEDLFYWVYATITTFSLLYQQSDGVIRAYIIVSVLLGMIVFNHLISKRILFWLKKVRKYIRIRLCKRKIR